MPSINHPDNFAGRVNLAALYITHGRQTSRAFDGCFENYDGDAVAVALYRRAQKNPDGQLAANLWRYLARESVEPMAQSNAHRANLAAWARELYAQGEAESRRRMAQLAERMEAEKRAKEEALNTCERAFRDLAARPDATECNSLPGPYLEIRRKIAPAGTVSDGTRVFIVTPCAIWRWMTVRLGWDKLGEFDQRNYHGDHARLVRDVLAVIEKVNPPQFREEPTNAGIQLVIPGCERRPVDNGKPAQLSLFG